MVIDTGYVLGRLAAGVEFAADRQAKVAQSATASCECRWS
jgi:hypothetical protein